MNEIVESGGAHAPAGQDPLAPIFQARALADHANVGSIEIEASRAIAEAQGAFVVAKRFPRDIDTAAARMTQSCKRLKFAESAFYAYSRGGQTVSGESIRMAEELARCYGNLDYGIRELSQKDGVSEMQAFCIDLETNVRSSQNFTVRHVRDTKSGGKALTEQRDIYEVTANMGARRLRARILAILPEDYIANATELCRQTLAGGGGVPLEKRLANMLGAFGQIGVTSEMLVAKLGHALASVSGEELAVLQGTYKAIRDGMTSVAEQFEVATGEGAANAIASAAKATKPVKPDTPKAPEPKAEPQSPPPPPPPAPEPAPQPQEATQAAEVPQPTQPEPASQPAAQAQPQTPAAAAPAKDLF